MRIFKTSFKNRQGLRQEAAKWYAEINDTRGVPRKFALFPDRALTTEVARKIEKLVRLRIGGEAPDLEMLRWLESAPPRLVSRLEKLGILDARRVAATKTLLEHAADFKEHLQAQRNTPAHVRTVTVRLERVFDGGHFTYWSDINATSVEKYLRRLRESDGRSVQTSNFYLQSIKQFATWMVRENRAAESPVSHLRALNVRDDKRRFRRAITLDELRRVLAATLVAPARFGMSGRERAVLYRAACETGLRRNELRSLRKADLNLTSKPPTVTIRATSSKNKREKVLPLRADLARELGCLVATKLPSAPVFSMAKSIRTAEMLRLDMKAADVKYEDESGRAYFPRNRFAVSAGAAS